MIYARTASRHATLMAPCPWEAFDYVEQDQLVAVPDAPPLPTLLAYPDCCTPSFVLSYSVCENNGFISFFFPCWVGQGCPLFPWCISADFTVSFARLRLAFPYECSYGDILSRRTQIFHFQFAPTTSLTVFSLCTLVTASPTTTKSLTPP